MSTVPLCAPTPTACTAWWWPGATAAEQADGARPGWLDTVDAALAAQEPADAPDPVSGRFVAAAVALLPAPTDDISRAIHTAFVPVLAARLEALAARTVIRELHRDRPPGRPDSTRRYARLRADLQGPGGLAELLARYPALARLLAVAAAGAAGAAGELVTRFRSERPLATPVDRVLLGAGDTHGGGRSVAVILAGDGTGVVYKPRSQALAGRFAEALTGFAASLGDPALRVPRVDERAGYGWCELITPSACADPAELTTFYRRHGNLLALLHALDCADMHHENLIAAGPLPALVDLETLFHPSSRMLPTTGVDPALDALADSVLRTGLLPLVVHTPEGPYDLSGLGGGIAQRGGMNTPRVVDRGTDAMRLARARVVVPATTSRPRLHGRVAIPDEHVDTVRAGFASGSRALASAAPDPGRFAGSQVRVVARETRLYALLLGESTHPDVLGSTEARVRLLRRELRDRAHGLSVDLVEQEVADLLDGDVPLFTIDIDDTTIRHRDRSTSARLPLAPLAAVRARAAAADSADRRRQQWVISASFATRAPAVVHRAATDPAAGAAAVANPDLCLARACAIADDLAASASTTAVRANWLGLELTDRRHWTLAALGAGYGDGWSGVALLLAELGRVTGTERYRALALAAARPLPGLLSRLAARPEQAQTIGGGAFAGLGGLLHVATRLDDCLPGHGFDLAAEDARTACAGAVTDDPTVDGGRAGTLAALSGWLVRRPDDVAAGAAADALAAGLTELAVAPGADRLLAGSDGLLSGTVGLAWALGGYARLEREHADRARTVARRLLDRPPADLQDLGWCRGLAGRAVAAAVAGDTAQARGYLDRLARVPLLVQHDACHGEAGLLDSLAVLARFGYGNAVDVLRTRAAGLLGVLAHRRPRCATPAGVPTPGLLTGLAGVSFGLLRAAVPDVPSPLFLEPPSGGSAAHHMEEKS